MTPKGVGSRLLTFLEEASPITPDKQDYCRIHNSTRCSHHTSKGRMQNPPLHQRQAPQTCFHQYLPNNQQSGNRKWWRQTGSRQSTPLSTIRTRYGNSVSTPEATRTCKAQQNHLQKRSRYGISVSTPHRRYGHRLRTPFFADAISKTSKQPHCS